MTRTRERTTWRKRYRVIPRTEQRSRGSRWLYRVDHYSSLPLVALTVGVLLLVAIGVGIALGFPRAWTVAFEAGTSGITLAMVFVIQHTQTQEQAATQRKLDELLRVMPGATTGLMMLEEASEETMQAVAESQRQHKQEHARR